MTSLYFPAIRILRLIVRKKQVKQHLPLIKTGALTSLSLNGKRALLSTTLTLSLFRPATDNDNRDRNGARLWRKAGLDNITQKVLSLKEGKSSTTARVEILNAKGQKVGTADFIYALDKNGALKVSTTFEPDTALCEINSSLWG